MDYKITNNQIASLNNEIKELEDLFDDKIVELHKVPGLQTERHSFILYRKLLWKIRETLAESIEEIKSE